MINSNSLPVFEQIFPADFTTAMNEANQEQANARAEAIVAIRKIETKLQTILAGRRLPGASDLLRQGNYGKYFGFRVRARFNDTPLQPDAYALCLTPLGVLEFASEDGNGDVETKSCLDSDLRAEDLEEILCLMAAILPEAVEKLKARKKRYADIRALAAKLAL